jgi:DNA repair ATPase RecN
MEESPKGMSCRPRCAMYRKLRPINELTHGVMVFPGNKILTDLAVWAILKGTNGESQISQPLPQLYEQTDDEAARRRALESIERILLPQMESVAVQGEQISAIQKHLETQQLDLEHSFSKLGNRLTEIEKRIEEIQGVRARLVAIEELEKKQGELESRLRRVLQAANIGTGELMSKIAATTSRVESQSVQADRLAESTDGWLKELSAAFTAMTEKLRLQQGRIETLEAGAVSSKQNSRNERGGNGEDVSGPFSRDIKEVMPRATPTNSRSEQPG